MKKGYQSVKRDFLYCPKCKLIFPDRYTECPDCDQSVDLSSVGLFTGKRIKSSKKGSPFEREFCGILSVWWTDGERDDVFWRTSGSGARATTRAKSGQKTFGNQGDIQAVDPIGAPLMKLFSWELKRGYTWDLIGLMDGKAKAHEISDFIEQAIKEKKEANTYHFAVVFRRDGRNSCILLPSEFYNDYKTVTGFNFSVQDRIIYKGNFGSVAIVRLEEWLEAITPEEVQLMVDFYRG